MAYFQKTFGYLLCLAISSGSCSQRIKSKIPSPRTDLVHLTYADLSTESLNDRAENYSSADFNGRFQRIATGPDQDLVVIPPSIIGNWEIFAGEPLNEKSPIRLVFKENGALPVNSLLFYPSYESIYESTAAESRHSKRVEEFTRFCRDRVVFLDISNAIVPSWYYSRMSEFSKLRFLRISHTSVNLDESLSMPKFLTGIELIDFPVDVTLLKFIRSIHGLKDLVLTGSYTSQVTTPVTKFEREHFEDWISIYRESLNQDAYHDSIDSLSLVHCDEPSYHAFLRLELPSLKTAKLGLEISYPGGGILRQTEALASVISENRDWPMIRNVSFFLGRIDRAQIGGNLQNPKSKKYGYSFERLLRQTIDESITGGNNAIFKYELKINSKWLIPSIDGD